MKCNVVLMMNGTVKIFKQRLTDLVKIKEIGVFYGD